MLSRRSGFAKLSSSLPYPWYNWPPLASATETLKWNFQIGPYMKQGNLLFGIYLSDSKYQRTYITDATVCLSVIQSKSSDVNPIWPSLFQHIQKPLPEKSWNQLAHSHSQLCAFIGPVFCLFEGKVCQHWACRCVSENTLHNLMVEGKQGTQVHPSFFKGEKESRNGLVDCRSSSRHCEPVIGDLWPLLGVERRRAGQPFNSSNTKWYEMIWN